MIPRGLTCIIGPRGSGKSTLAEALRFAVCGSSAAPKQCVDLIQANLAGGALVTVTALAEGSGRYTIKRGLKQQPVLLNSDGKTIHTVDLDRGTFLPMDAYSSPEIEAIADEVLGQKRRNLLDELRSEQMRTIHLSLAESARALDASADRIRTTQRTIQDLTEQIEELGDVRAQLSAIVASDREPTADFVRLSRQQQLNQREMNAVNKSSTCWKAEGRRSNCGRSDMQAPEAQYEELRRLVVEDPREARRAFLQLLDSSGAALDQFLGSTSSPADGRLRQLVANALRNHRDRERLAARLIAWQEIETDEFTHRAIVRALNGLDTRSAGQTALALEVARLTTAIGREMAQRERLNRELEIAQEVQQHLFPQRLPAMPGLDYVGHCRPAREVGGDYYDFLALSDGRLGIAIGDVSGKGIGAALMMACVEASLRSQALVDHNLAELMQRVNSLICEASSANRYVTLFYAEYNPANRQLAYVNAGHNPPLILRKSAELCQVFRLETGGPVIGLLQQHYQEGSFPLEPEDLVLLFTDGVSESMNAREEEWGEDRLIEFAKTCHGLSASEAMTRILAAAEAFAGGASQHDDMTLVVLRVLA
jgi:serine phosphatase RsbU (regulator of sigma subunit)